MMRVKYDDAKNGTHYFYNIKSTLKSVILAGRYFANFCGADPYQESYELFGSHGVATLIQSALRNDYNLVIHTVANGAMNTVFEGNPSGRNLLPILWHNEGDISDYFGLRSDYILYSRMLDFRVTKYPQVSDITMNMITKCHWLYKIYPSNISVTIPVPYIDVLPSPYVPSYRHITKKSFIADIKRTLPSPFQSWSSKIIRTSINLDKYGM